MNNTYERQKDILKLISQLDISVTMYKNADEKYHAVAKFLEDCGIDATSIHRDHLHSVLSCVQTQRIQTPIMIWISFASFVPQKKISHQAHCKKR